MAQQNNQLSMPGTFGGLTRFNEEYESKIMLKPIHVIVLIALIVLFRIGLGIFL